MDRVIERLKTEFNNEDARYAYADSVTNAFLTSQIKELREARDLTQERLAELVGTRQSGVSRWQHSGYANCKIGTLRKFAKAFGVRLRVSFEEFGTLPSDVGGFTKGRLAPRKFEDDPAFQESTIIAPESEEVVARVNESLLKLLSESIASQSAPQSLLHSWSGRSDAELVKVLIAMVQDLLDQSKVVPKPII